MVGFSLSLTIYLRSTLDNGGQIRLRKHTTAYMLALSPIPSPNDIAKRQAVLLVLTCLCRIRIYLLLDKVPHLVKKFWGRCNVL